MPTKKPKQGQSLAELHPSLAKQWHPTKNGTLTSHDISSGTGKKIWWKCDEGDDHEWIASPNNRSKGRGCQSSIFRWMPLFR
jgi:hypothetical protein